MTKELGGKVQLVGDDFFVTNTERLQKGIETGLRQLDPHQAQPDRFGLPRRSKPSSMAHRAGYTAIVSHRSGETEDTTIADLAVALNACQIKTGAPQPQRTGCQIQPAAPD